jgi:excisionase family DNA binding protein
MTAGLEQVAYSRREVAELTSLSFETVRRAINRGDLPAKKVGRRVLVLAKDLDAWLDAQPSY